MFTEKEIRLNADLYNECIKEKVDFNLVEYFLIAGADPLGPIDSKDMEEHLYGLIITDALFTNSVNLPQLTELFIRYGMVISKPKIAYDSFNSINPIWCFGLAPNENSLLALKILLDNGLDIDSVSEFISHITTDLLFVDKNFFPVEKEPSHYLWAMKMIFLIASYKDYLNDKYLSDFICVKDNNYDLEKFREYKKFDFNFENNVAKIYEIETKKTIWKITLDI
ncbi:MAG: hypothetical protein IKB98_03525 [Clostridia bacterium]|nr:hypothetical protein [Clostridia bacterium]